LPVCTTTLYRCHSASVDEGPDARVIPVAPSYTYVFVQRLQTRALVPWRGPWSSVRICPARNSFDCTLHKYRMASTAPYTSTGWLRLHLTQVQDGFDCTLHKYRMASTAPYTSTGSVHMNRIQQSCTLQVLYLTQVQDPYLTQVQDPYLTQVQDPYLT
jgi:hypothetical protein